MSDYTATEDRTMPGVVYGLYFLGIPTAGLTSLIGLIVALAQRPVSGPVSASHYSFLVRTFVLGLVWCVAWGAVLLVSIPFSFILIGIPFMALAGVMLKLGLVWYVIRLILGVIYLARGDAYPRPYSWLA
jgi:uncharacterized membrane protein